MFTDANALPKTHLLTPTVEIHVRQHQIQHLAAVQEMKFDINNHRLYET